MSEEDPPPLDLPKGGMGFKVEKGGEAEKLIFEGSVSLLFVWKPLALGFTFFFLGLGGLVGGFFLNPGLNRWILITLGGALTFSAGLMIPYAFLLVRCLRFRITSRMIERQQGILVRRTDCLDLARVRDVQLTQTFIQRLLALGTLELYSSDKTDPSMLIEDIAGARRVYEGVRDAVMRIAQRRGIIPLDRS